MVASKIKAASKALPQSTPKKLPITIGVGEPFTTTLTVCAYFALLFTLPLLLYEAYAFVIPALSPRSEDSPADHARRAGAVPDRSGVRLSDRAAAGGPLSAGIQQPELRLLVQAKPLYSFEILTMAGIGLAFQMPLGLLAPTAPGVINGSTLTRNWRYATVIIAVIAAAMPGADPVTTGLETLPLVILFWPVSCCSSSPIVVTPRGLSLS